MASRHADRQRRYRQRLSARGLLHVQGWVTPEQAEAIRRVMTARREGGIGRRAARTGAGCQE